MSNLLKQLNTLKVKQNNSETKLPYNSYATFLFDYKDAKKIDNESIFELGYQGIINLIKIDKKFENYLKIFFNHTSKYFNYEIITQNEINDYIEKLKELLNLLSNYFFDKNCHLVIEYLLRIFKINLMLSNEVILSFLCYFHSQYFIKLIQNINFEIKNNSNNINDIFNFLENFAKKGEILNEENFYNFLIENSRFNLLSKIVYHFIENIDITNIYYFEFIFTIFKKKFENLNNVKNLENIIILFIKVINYFNINFEDLNKFYDDNKIIEKYLKIFIQTFLSFIENINLNNEIYKNILNEINNKIFKNIENENYFEIIINFILINIKISKKYYENNKEESLYKQNSIEIFINKTDFIKNLFNNNNNLIENKDIEFFLYELLIFQINDEIKNKLIHFVNLFLNEQIIFEKIIKLSLNFKYQKEIFDILSNENKDYFNNSVINLYNKKIINNFEFLFKNDSNVNKNVFDIFINLISKSINDNLKAINSIKSLMEIDKILIDLIANKFDFFDNEIILNSLLNLENLELNLISKNILNFYINIHFYFNNKNYSDNLINLIEKKLLIIYKEDNLIFNIFKNIIFNKNIFNFKEDKNNLNNNVYFELFYENLYLILNQNFINKNINIKNINNFFDYTFKYIENNSNNDNKILFENIFKILSENKIFLNYENLYFILLKNCIIFLKYNKNKFKYINDLIKIIIKINSNFENNFNQILKIHFSNNIQIFLAYILYNNNLNNNKILIDFIEKFLRDEKNIELLLLFSLLNNISTFSYDNIQIFFGKKFEIRFNNYFSLFEEKINENNKINNKKNKEIILNLIENIYMNKNELKINKNHIEKIFNKKNIDFENLYILINEIFLNNFEMLINKIYEFNINNEIFEIYEKLLNLFLKKDNKIQFNEDKKTLILNYINNFLKINNENNNYMNNNFYSNIFIILIKNFLNFFDKSEIDLIKILKEHNLFYKKEIFDIIFKNKFTLENINYDIKTFFDIIKFSNKNSITAFKFNFILNSKEILDIINYLISNFKMITFEDISYFYDIILFNLSKNEEEENDKKNIIIEILQKTFQIIKLKNEINLNLSYILYKLTNYLQNNNNISDNILNNLIKEGNNLFENIINNINKNEGDLNYENEKKISLILSFNNNLILLLKKENIVIINCYNLIKDKNDLSNAIKNNIYLIIFDNLFNYLNNENSYNNFETYKKYVDIIVNHNFNEIFIRNEIFKKFLENNLFNKNLKILSYFYYNLYNKFENEKINILNEFIFNKNKELNNYFDIVLNLLKLKFKYNQKNFKENILFEMINNILIYINKNDYNNEKEFFDNNCAKIIKIVNYLYNKSDENIDKIIEISKKFNYLENLIKIFYSKKFINKKLSSKNFFLKKISKKIKEDNYNLFDFIIENVILKENEKKIENYNVLYNLLEKIINENSNIELIKNCIEKIFSSNFNNENFQKNLKDVNYLIYFLIICKFLIEIFNLFSVQYLNYFNSFIPIFIEILENNLNFYNENSNKEINKNINKIFKKFSQKNLSQFLSPFLNDFIKVVIKFNNNEFIEEFLKNISKNNIFDKNYDAIKNNKEEINNNLLFYLNETILNIDKLIVVDYYKEISEFFYEIFILNNILLNTCIKNFILKINEKQLKNIFDYYFELINQKNENKEYNLKNCINILSIFNIILTTIKEIFLKYFSKYKNILINLINFSQDFLFKKNLSPQKLNTKTKRDLNIDKNYNYEILTNILLENLSLNLKFNKNKVINYDHIEEFLESILNYFKIKNIKEKEYENFFENNLCNLILILFNNLNEELFKSFNDDILYLLREENYLTKLYVLKLINFLYLNLKEKYLILNGDIIPYISDLLEDENENVQKEAINIINYVEKTTGESYKNYLE